LLNWFAAAPRRALLLLAAVCAAMLGFGLYLQHIVGLEPCPMCIVQRYALILIALVSILAGATGRKSFNLGGAAGVLLFAGFGSFVAARQSWLQWYPPESATCGRDFYGMIETFPLQRVIPMIFKGSGDCTKIDWTFLGLSLANWSFLSFMAIALTMLVLIGRLVRRPATG